MEKDLLLKKIEDLRQELFDLQKKREKITLVKGLIAEDNKDLRENSAYDYWEMKERNITGKINMIIKEIYNLSAKIKEKQDKKTRDKKKRSLA